MIKTLDQVLTLDRPMLGFDLETTGTSDQQDRIVEIGLEIMIPGKDTKPYRTLVNPERRIPPAATRIHGITDEMVQGAPTFKQLAPNLLKGFAGADFAGYNVRFDLRVVKAEFKRAGHSWDYEAARILDGLRLWQIAEGRTLSHAVDRWLKGGTSNPTRDAEIAAELDRDGHAHNALWDVRMVTRIIAAQLTECPDKLPADIQKLHDLCAPGWYDAEGKIQWKEGAWCLTFGEHRGKPLGRVPESYMKWMLSKDFSEKVKAALRVILEGGEIPTPVQVEDSDDSGL